MSEKSDYIDVKELLSYCDDIVEILRLDRDANALTQCLEHSKAIKLASDSDFDDSQAAVLDYKKKIDDCKQKIAEARSEIIADQEIDHLQKELDEELRREQNLLEEFRVIVHEMNELDHEQLSIEEQRQKLKKLEEEEEKEQRKLSFYASVTKIVPDLKSEPVISGYMVEREKRVINKFEFDPETEDPFEICNNTWKMVNK